MPARGYSYLRFSSAAQRLGDSIRRQIEWTERRAAQLGILLDDTRRFVDEAMPSFRGQNAEVGQLARFLDLAERGLITPGSYLFVESLDRLSREDVWDAWEVFRRIIQAGVNIVTREPDRTYSLTEIAGNWFALLEPLFIFARGNNESRTKSMRARESWEERRARAREGQAHRSARPPRWLEEREGQYFIIEEEGIKIRRIFQLCIDGMSPREIAALLNREEVSCPGRLGVWTHSYVREIIRRRTVRGEYQPARRDDGGRHIPVGEPIPGFYPHVVDEETWLRAQLAIKQRRGKRGRPAGTKDRVNLFVGLVREAETGEKLSVCGRCGEYSYLGNPIKSGERISYQRFEACLLDTLAMIRPEDVLECGGEQRQREEAIAALTGELTALGVRIERLEAQAADLEEDADAIVPILVRVRKDRKRVAGELERLKLEGVTGRAEALVEAQSLAKLYRKTQGADREALARRIRAALPSVIEGIWVLQQKVNAKRYVTHIQVYLLSGGKRCVQLLPEHLHGVDPWQLDDADFRRGEVGNAASVSVGAEP